MYNGIFYVRDFEELKSTEFIEKVSEFFYLAKIRNLCKIVADEFEEVVDQSIFYNNDGIYDGNYFDSESYDPSAFAEDGTLQGALEDLVTEFSFKFDQLFLLYIRTNLSVFY